MKYSRIIALVIIAAVVWGCSKETVEPEFYGSISGQVIDSETRGGLANATIATKPATEVFLTNSDGTFTLHDVPTGSVVIEAEKKGYLMESVNVTVREDKSSTAVIVMEADEEEQGSEHLNADVITWAQWERNDSTFVDVEYRVENNSTGTNIDMLEVYFGIYTPQTNFYYEVRDSSLSAGEMSVGQFTRYIRRASVDSVSITGTWTSN